MRLTLRPPYSQGLPYKQRIVELLTERKITNDGYREWRKVLLDFQLAYEAKALQLGCIDKDTLRTKYAKLITQDVGSLLSSMPTVKRHVNKGGWGKNLGAAGKLDAFLEVVHSLAHGHLDRD